MKNLIKIICVLGISLLAISACSPTDDEPATSEDIGDGSTLPVAILSTSSFMDDYGGYHVVGEVLNNTGEAISGIELGISLLDSSGASLLTDPDGNILESLSFYPLLWTLDNGERSPFAFYFDGKDGIPATYSVDLVKYDPGIVSRGQLEYQNVQIIESGISSFILTGELVNLGSQWVHISGLAGGVMDDSGTILSADSTNTFSAALAPAGDAYNRDHTPFIIDFPIPPTDATQWFVSWDADTDPEIVDYPLVVTVTNSYFDEFSAAHLVGTIANYSDLPLSTVLVAGLYAEDGMVLDAGYLFLGVPIQPGASIPFDISYFDSVNRNEEQAALVNTYSVQFDAWSTITPLYEPVELNSSGETIEKNVATWVISGEFTNTSSSNLSQVTILVAIYDGSNNLVATGYTFAYPSDEFFAPGDSGTYDISVFLDPGSDSSGYSEHTYILSEPGD